MSKTNDCFLSYKGQKISLSEAEYQTIQEVLKITREGNSFTIVPDNKYMTTQEAADLLNVSRPYLVKLLDQKEIPYIQVGNRRKILAEDVFCYLQKRDANRRKILREFSLGIKEDGLYDLDSDELKEIINQP
ncbi:MAG: helix-turn-helix domain-containing protein [Xenococcaceae cyanobacterium]